MTKKSLMALVLLVTSLQVFATTTVNDINLNWLNRNYFELKQDIKSSNFKTIVPIANTLGLIWLKRDGATAGEVSPLIASLLIKQPNIMLSILSQYPEEYQKWLEELQSSLLTDFSGGEEEALEETRLELIQSMEMINEAHSLKPFADQLANKLKLLSVRVID
ncbi:hypothetical protein [Agarivorans gilvus]|uniref:DUF2059 domain-containing protein n=1 Tax=Agarivorans gilvus TaxID=680279 RepID=A0ABQ1I6S4_9ALTE|nr:hypothetical protein [Agarivorans gilvus]GGB22241.1 hypothetical protein GCM10007414_39530 [Agarivorans gilvus]